MKKINKILLAVFSSSVLLFAGCSSFLEEKDGGVSEYGTLVIGTESGRAVDVNTIKTATITVTGNDRSSGSPITPVVYKGVAVSSGAGTVAITGIPVGKNRIITVKGYDSSSAEIDGAVLRAVTDIKAGSNTIETITWLTSRKGYIYNALFEGGVNIHSLTAAEISAIDTATPAVAPENINLDLFTADFKSGYANLKDADEYILGSGKTLSYIKLAQKSGEGVSFSATAYYTDSTTDEITSSATWTSSVPAAATVSGGVVTLVAKGTTVITADYGGKTSNTATVKVSSDGSDGYLYFTGAVSGSNNWGTASAVFFAWFSNGSSGQWYALEETDTQELYRVEIPSGATSVIFVRAASGTTLPSDVTTKSALSYWNATAELTISSSYNTFIPNGWSGCSGSWSYVDYGGGEGSLVASVTLGSVVVPAKPSVTITPADGSNISLTGTITVAFTENNDTITSRTVKINGSSYIPAENTYSIKVSDLGITADGTIINVTASATSSCGTAYASSELTAKDYGNASHRDFREETIYFMMTDRFCDGDTTNNNIWGDEYLPNGESDMYTYDESKTGVLSYYHGGDFKGIIDNLDYIADMGFTAIWITPVVRQCEGRYYYGSEYEASAFHGYWGYNFDQIDPHLHSSGKDSDGWDDYKALIAACHAKGIKVMQDIVVNHGQNPAATSPTKWYDKRNTVIMDGSTWTWKTQDPYYSESGSTAAGGKEGFFSYAWGASCAGLIDFNEEGPDDKSARQHLINVYKRFIEAGVDAFRIDTVAYMTAEWWGYFADTMYNYAKSLGNDYFYMVGEAWGGRGASLNFHSKDTTNSFHQLDMTASCMDYPGEMKTVFQSGGDYGRFVSLTTSESMEPSAEDSTWMGMFVDNHDVYRCNGVYNETQYKNALNYIYLFRGVPIVYYGTESMYAWDGAHATTNKDDVCARWMLGSVGINYVKNNQPAMYKHLKMLNAVHAASPCIQKGAQENISVSGDTAVLKRTYDSKSAYIVISKGDSVSYSFSSLPDGTYKKYTSTSTGVPGIETITVSGSYSVTSPANGFCFIEQQ